MVEHTNKKLDFLSNDELINILRSVLDEIDVIASSQAHRSTTYLAVSAIEGLCGELLKLLRIEPSDVPGIWPTYKLKDGTVKDKTLDQFTLEDMLKVLKAKKALPKNFEALYDEPLRKYRNFIHPAREHKDLVLNKRLPPIAQSVGQLAVAGLNALIEKYEPRRFIAMQEWCLEYGVARVPVDNVIHMPPDTGDAVSLLVSEKLAEEFREMKFRVIIPSDKIFNFIYSYFSRNNFMGARIEGRERSDGKGSDNGRLHCTGWRNWTITGNYTDESEPDPKAREHSVHVVMDPPGTLTIKVDDKVLILKDKILWDFDPKGKVGFLTELGGVSIVDLEVQEW